MSGAEREIADKDRLANIDVKVQINEADLPAEEQHAMTETQRVAAPAINLAGLEDSDDDEAEKLDNVLKDLDIDVELSPEERHQLLIRQCDIQINTAGLNVSTSQGAGPGAAAATAVSLGTITSVASPGEKCALVLGWLLSGFTGLLLPCFIFMLGPVFDSFGPDQSKEDSLRQVGYLVLTMGVLAILVWLCAWLSYHLTQRGALGIVRRLKKKFFEAVLVQESEWFDKVNYSQLATRISADCQQIEIGIGQKLGLLVQSAAMTFAGFLLAFIKGWSLAFAMLLLLPILMIGLTCFIKQITAKMVISASAFAQVAAFADEALNSIRIVMAFGMEEIEIDSYMQYVKRHLDLVAKVSVKTAFAQGLFIASMYFGYSYAFTMGAVWVDQEFENHAFDRNYTAGDIISIFFGILLGVFALGGLGPNIAALAAAKAAGQRAFDVIWRTPLIQVDDPAAETHKLEGKIRFDNVSFHYPSRPDNCVLKDFSWTFLAGQTTAIVGPSGSGKSTVVQLIERFYDPSSGQILIDDKPLPDLKLRHLRSQIGYVGQEPVLFNTSIHENVLLGKPNASEQEVEAALRSTNAWDFVQQQPDKAQTQAGSGGSQLSGGEKQRIALSRAFIKKPKLLIFDEATSALDKKNEQEVQKSIEHMKKELGQVSTILIAHRLSTVVNADTIIVMKKGKIVEYGNHRTLLAKNGLYAELVATQEALDQEADQEAPQENQEETKQPNVPKTEERQETDFGQNMSNAHNALIPPGNDEQKQNQSLTKKEKIDGDTSAVAETELDKEAAALMEQCDKKIKEQEQQDEKAVEHITMSYTERKIKRMAQPCIMKLITVLTSMFAGAVGPVLGYMIMRCMIGVEVAQYKGENGLEAIYIEIIVVFSLSIVAFFAKSFQQTSLMTIMTKLCYSIRREIYESVMRKQMSWHDEKLHSPAIIGNQLNADVAQLSVVAIDITAMTLEGVGGILIGLAIALVLSWPIALIIVGMAPIMMIGSKVGTRVKMKQWNMVQTQKEGTKTAEVIIGDAITHFKTVASIANHTLIVDNYDKINEERCILENKESNCEGFLFGFSEFMKNFAFGLVYLAQAILVYYFPDAEVLRPDKMFPAMFALMFGIFSFLGAKGAIASDADKVKLAASKIFKVTETKSVIDPLSRAEDAKKQIKRGSLRGKIEFRDVWFRYPARPGQWIFRGLNLTVDPDEVIAIVGESGAGKSTFISLLMRFYDPERGQVLIDDVDVKDYNVRDLRREMGLVMQEPALFNTTIRENILYGYGDASNDKIRQAADTANAIEFIETNEISEAFEDKPGSLLQALQSDTYKNKVIEEVGQAAYDQKVKHLQTIFAKQGGAAAQQAPIAGLYDRRTEAQRGSLSLHQGFDVVCGVKGSKLSGGQKQRVAIARAVVRDPRILMLDEATSALDEISQAKVQKALENVMRGRTSIVVAHRLTTVEKCSRVAVIQDGQIVQHGRLQELKNERDGYFANLAAGMQKKQSQYENALLKKASSVGRKQSSVV